MRENYDRRTGKRVSAPESAVELLDYRPRLRDLSQTGVFVEDPRPLPSGRTVRLLLRLSPNSRAITVLGMVRRVEEGKGMGIEFIQISSGDRAILQHFLREQAESREIEDDLDL
jgi:c-di-GMP-binding flagellar brake protein YcgR